LPGQLGSGFVITGRRIVMEAMIRAVVNVRGVGQVIGLEHRLVGLPSTGDARVQRSIVKQQGRLDLGGILGIGLATVERNRSPQVREPHGKIVDGGSAKTKAQGADLAGAFGPSFQPGGRRHKVLKHFLLVDHFEKVRCFLFIARVSANRCETIGRKGQEIRCSQTARDVFDIRVQAAVFVYHQYSGQLSISVRGTNEIPSDASVALWRRYGRIFRLDLLVVLGDLLCQSVIRPETFPDGHRRQAAYGILLCGIQEFTAAELAVNVTIKYVQQLLRKIGRFFLFNIKGCGGGCFKPPPGVSKNRARILEKQNRLQMAVDRLIRSCGGVSRVVFIDVVRGDSRLVICRACSSRLPA
jgi:hypothetical protein